MTDSEERQRLALEYMNKVRRNRVANDPATPGESTVINYSIKSALAALQEAGSNIRSIRVSNET